MKTSKKTAYTLIEILVCLAIISSLAAIGLFGYQNIQGTSNHAKLDNDVRVLNSAIRLYKTNGGQFTATTAEDALRQIRRKADPTTKSVGMRGSMVDERLTTRYQTSEEAAGNEKRVYFDATKQAFYVANSGSQPGVKEFYLGSAPPPLPTYVDASGKTVDPNLDDRQTYGKFASADRWVWDYNEVSSVNHGTPIDTGNNVGTPTINPPSSDNPVIKLPPPLFSTPGGGFDLSWYPQSISLLPDPDVPANVSEIHYLSAGGWVRYNAPITITEPGQVITAKLVSTDFDNYSDSDETSSAYNAGPFLLDVASTLRASYSYTDLGGPLLTGSTAPVLAPVPRISLANAAGLPDQFENAGVFQTNWTWNGADPLTTTPLSGNGSFTNGYPGDDVPLSLATFGNGNLATLKVAAISKKSNLVQSSTVKTYTTRISVLTLPPPLVSRSTNATTLVQTVTLTLDPAGNKTPANARIFYRIDDQDPGNINGEPAAGATLYTGPITVDPAVASVTSIRARVYAPSAYKAWFTPSSDTYLEPLFNPYLLEAGFNLPATYTYTQLGGALAPGSAASTPLAAPVLTLANAGDIPNALENAAFFQGNWTLDGSNPLTATPLRGNSAFTGGYPGDSITVSFQDFASNGILTLKAATVSKNENVHRSSDVVAKTATIQTLALRAPKVSRSTNASTLVQTVTMALDITGNQTPANARIYYCTDGTDPGTTNGEPKSGATLYTGPITVTAANGSTTSFRARVYAPTAYKAWFTPSSDTYLEPLFDPYPLDSDFTLPATYNYVQLGGTLAPGSGASTPLAAPVLTLTNAADIPTALENAAFFQANWTFDGTNPTTATPLRGNSTFTGGYPGDTMAVSLSNFTNGVLTLKAAAVSKNAGLLTSDVVTKSATIQTLPLLSPLVNRSIDATTLAQTITMSLDLTGNQTPANARIFYRTDGTDPGNTNGEPNSGATFYSGPITVSAASAPTTNIKARVYAPTAYKSWFTPSSATNLPPQANLIQLVSNVNLPATYNYVQLGGTLAPGSTAPTPVADPVLTLSNAADIANSLETAANFQGNWTFDGSDPLTKTPRLGNNTFTNGYPGDTVPISLLTFSSNSTLTLKSALISTNAGLKSSAVVTKTVTIDPLQLLAPVVSRSTNSSTLAQTVTMALDLTGNQTPANARIFYRTDGTDPGNNNGEPNSGATLYSGPITVSAASAATTNIKARVYAPTAYKPWFTPSSATNLLPQANLIQLVSNVNLPATYNYVQLGGTLAPGSTAPTPVADPVLTLTNAADISNTFETAAHFQGNWTFDGSDPLTKTPRLGNNTFTNGYPGDTVPISLLTFSSNSTLTLKSALISTNAAIKSSAVVTKTATIDPLQLLAPLVSRTSTGDPSSDKPLGIAQDFSIFAYGNIELVSGGGSTVGGVAAGGNLKYGYNGGFYMGGKAGRDALVVQGVLDTNGNGSLNNGNVAYGSTPNASLINAYNGTKRQATNVINFPAIKTSHLALSAQWKARPNTGGASSITYGTPGGDGKVPITLNAGNLSGTVVFNMDASKLVNVAYWNINNVNSGATLLITIPGATPTLQNFYISNGGTANQTIFHFPDATTATFSSVGIPGTVFAPKALVSLGSNGSQIGGQIIADRMDLRSFHNGGQYTFTGTIPGNTVHTVTMALNITGNQTPANARIYYRTDGTDPGNNNGEPNSGATLYTGPITVSQANAATTNIKARVYAPTAYKPWFTTSTVTQLAPPAN